MNMTQRKSRLVTAKEVITNHDGASKGRVRARFVYGDRRKLFYKKTARTVFREHSPDAWAM